MIEKDPDILDGRAHFKGTRICVHEVIERKQIGMDDADMVRDINGYPYDASDMPRGKITLSMIQEALDYFQMNPVEILDYINLHPSI